MLPEWDVPPTKEEAGKLESTTGRSGQHNVSFRSMSLHVSPGWEERRNAAWLTANEGPECTHWTTSSSVSTRRYDWTSPWYREGCANTNDVRDQTAPREPGAWPTSTNEDNTH